MCGRFTLRTPAHELARQFELFDGPQLSPRYNIAPSQQIAAIRRAADPALAPPQGRELVLLRWGLIPHWAQDTAIGNRTINARGETAATKPTFRSAFARRRCLIPADGFYEWRAEGGRKQPYLIQRGDQRPMLLAGLWDEWRGPDETIRSATIVTTSANNELRALHERMPVILGPDQIDAWLDPDGQREQLEALLRPLPEGQLELVPVSTLVNSPANDRPECVEPIAPATKPETTRSAAARRATAKAAPKKPSVRKRSPGSGADTDQKTLFG